MKRYFIATLAAVMLTGCVTTPVVAADVVTETFAASDTAQGRAIKLNSQVQQINGAFAGSVALTNGVFNAGYPFNISFTNSTRSRFWVSKYTGGSGHTDAPKWGSPDSQYLQLGGREYGSGSIRGIGFGYVGDPTQLSPAFVGYQEQNTAGGTNGDLLFATRGDTGTAVPSERLRIKAAGDIVTASTYVPGTSASVARSRDAVGAVILDTGTPAPTTFNNNEVHLLNGATQFTIPKIPIAGVIDGSRFYLKSYKAGTLPKVTYGSSCYTLDTIDGACPTTIRVGELWEFISNGANWRAFLLTPAVPVTVVTNAASYTMTQVNSENTIVATKVATQINVGTAAALGVRDGDSITITAMTPTGKTVTFVPGDKIWIADPTNANGYVESTNRSLQPGSSSKLVWNASAQRWLVVQ